VNEALGEMAYRANEAGKQIANQMSDFMDRVRYG